MSNPNPTLTPNSPVAGSIAWSSFSLQYQGVSYSLSAASTSNLYSYWVFSDPSNIQTSNTPPTLGPDDTLLFINRGGTPIYVIDDDFIDGALIASGTISGASLTAASVSQTQLGPGSVGTAQLVANSVGTGQLQALAVTQVQLAADAVGTAQIADGAVGTAQIANNAVTFQKLSTVPFGLLATGVLNTGITLVTGGVTNNTFRTQWDSTGFRLVAKNGSGVDSNLALFDTSAGLIYLSTPEIINARNDQTTTIDAFGRATSTDTGSSSLQHGLNFGFTTSGEGIRSNRNPVDTFNSSANRQGLDFYTNNQVALQLYNNGVVAVPNDLQIMGQSVARGILSYTLNNTGGTTPTSGAETACMYLPTLTQIVVGRKYRCRFVGVASRSDGLLDVAEVRMRLNNVTSATITGTSLGLSFHVIPASFVGDNIMKEVIFQGGTTTNVSPALNTYATVAAGNWSICLTLQKLSGGTSSATMSLTGYMTLEDVGT